MERNMENDKVVFNIFPKSFSAKTIGVLWAFEPDGNLFCFTCSQDKITKDRLIIAVTPTMDFSELCENFGYLHNSSQIGYLEKIKNLWRNLGL